MRGQADVMRLAATLLLALALLTWQPGALAASDVADAVSQNDAARLKGLLAAHADVNAAQPDGSTALHWAAYHGDAATAAALLAAGAQPNVATETGMTPLVMACEAGNPQLVRLLLQAGADANQTLGNGETPLMMAARTGSVPILEQLLSRGARVDARDKLRGTTALMWAAAAGNADAARLLIAKGAEVSARSGTVEPGRKPYLAQTGRERIQEFAFGYGLAGVVVKQDSPESQELVQEQISTAKSVLNTYPLPPPKPRSKKKWGGLTPLIFAARQGDLATVKVLLDAGRT